jgi:hypothetical protein
MKRAESLPTPLVLINTSIPLTENEACLKILGAVAFELDHGSLKYKSLSEKAAHGPTMLTIRVRR